MLNQPTMLRPQLLTNFPSMSFSAAAAAPKIQIKINKNPVTTDIAALEQTLPSKEAPLPECFFPDSVPKV